MLVLAVGGLAGIAAIVFATIKHSEAYSRGVDLARHNNKVIELLGEPVETGWWVSGSINVSGSSGEADLAVPLSGRRNKGMLYVLAHKRAGEWKFERAEVEIDGQQQRIDLLAWDKPPKTA
jgi:hypothetical protein